MLRNRSYGSYGPGPLGDEHPDHVMGGGHGHKVQRGNHVAHMSHV